MAHGGFTVVQEREQGIFGNTYPVAHGTHRDRAMVVRFGTNGYRQSREASETHTVVSIPDMRGLPPGLRIFPAIGGGLKAKGGARGVAQSWLADPRHYGPLTAWLSSVGYVSLSDRLGLAVHLEGVDIAPERLIAWLDEVVDLAESLEAPTAV